MSEILNYREAADFLGIKPETLRKWVQFRRIPFLRYNKRNVKFKRSELLNWQEQKTFEPVGETKNVRQQRKEERLKKSALENEIDDMLAVHYGNKIPRQTKK
jgi:excisionase family DNA binding protein